MLFLSFLMLASTSFPRYPGRLRSHPWAGLRWNKTGGCEISLSSFVLLAGRDGKRIMMVWICSYVILHPLSSSVLCSACHFLSVQLSMPVTFRVNLNLK